MSEQCVLYDRECINCGDCDNCDLDSSKHCDNCGRCLNLTEDYLTIDVADFIKKSEEDSKKIKITKKIK
jgi:hypothetical protein